MSGDRIESVISEGVDRIALPPESEWLPDLSRARNRARFPSWVVALPLAAAVVVIAAMLGSGLRAVRETPAAPPTPTPAPLVVPSAGPSPTPGATPAKGTSQPFTIVYCGALTQFAAPTATNGGSITIDRPGNRRDRGGPVSFGLPSGTLAQAPAGWTCIRFIPGAPASAFVALVGPGTEGYFEQPTPTPFGEYANPSLLYYFTLPQPYRRSAVLGTDNMGPDVASGILPATSEAFTARSKTDEDSLAGQRCDSACAVWNYVAVVEMFTNLDSPRQWYTKRGSVAGETIEDLVIDGRAAIKVTNGATYPVQIIINDRTWMLRVAYQIYAAEPVPAGASKAKLEEIVASFHFTQ